MKGYYSKMIRRMNNTLFDAAGIGILIVGSYVLLFMGPLVIFFTVWAVRRIKEIKEQNKRREEAEKACFQYNEEAKREGSQEEYNDEVKKGGGEN
jgi:hypothetical protein